MEMSLIASSPATGRDFSGNYNYNTNQMFISSSATKSQMGFRQIMTRCPNLPLRVTARSLSHSQPAAFTADNTIDNPKDGVKLYVGLPMNSVSDCHAINHSRAISAGLRALKLLGVDGVELPIWWGVAEKEAMGKYQWSGYLTLVDMIQKAGLKLHVSLCFHAASKHDNIPLPKWVSEIGESEPDVFFADRSGKRYKDCLSFGVDHLPVFDGKTAIDIYQGFIESFKTSFSSFMGSTITGITIGMGPDGDLQYPSQSHHLEDRNKHKIGLGAGEFQCYDQNMMNHLKKHAENLGNPLWGLAGPHDAPSYGQQPILNTFFKEEGSWGTTYGDFFLSWYSTQLVSHADKILSMAASTFRDTPVTVSGKLPLIHSWYRTRSHPAEVAAGFYNRYEEIIKVFSKNSCTMILPGMDLLDERQPSELCSSPEMLLQEIRDGCRRNGVEVCGQNSEIAGSCESFEQIRKNLVGGNGMEMFVYQRMGADFFSPEKFRLFTAFVRRIKELDLELDSDDLAENERGNVLSVAGKNRKLQAA